MQHAIIQAPTVTAQGLLNLRLNSNSAKTSNAPHNDSFPSFFVNYGLEDFTKF